MTYDVDYFIKKFEAIPEEMWCVGALINNHGQRCAQGHCGPVGLMIGEVFCNDEVCGLVNLIHAVVDINNGEYPHYQQPTPKQRILAALYDIKKIQQPKVEPEVKERIVYVSVPETIKTQSKELVLN